MIRKLKAEQRSKLPKLKPGKRQRAKLKAQIFGNARGKTNKQEKSPQDLEQNRTARRKAKKAKKQKINRQKKQKA